MLELGGREVACICQGRATELPHAHPRLRLINLHSRDSHRFTNLNGSLEILLGMLQSCGTKALLRDKGLYLEKHSLSNPRAKCCTSFVRCRS